MTSIDSRIIAIIGLEAATRMICSGSTNKAVDSAGLVDAVVADPLNYAQAHAAGIAKRNLGAISLTPLDDDSVQRLFESFFASHRGSEAARAAFHLLVRSPHLSFEQVLAEERAIFLRLRDSDTAKALRYVFKAERRAGQIQESLSASAAAIARVALAGGCTMGTGIAQACLASGIDAVLVERDAASAVGARRRIEEAYETLVKRCRMDAIDANK